MQSFRQIGLKLGKIGAIQNRYPIVVYGVWCNERSSESKPSANIGEKSTKQKKIKLVSRAIQDSRMNEYLN